MKVYKTYDEMTKAHSKEFNDFDIRWAFDMTQLKDAFNSWGLDIEKDKDKVEPIGCGGLILKDKVKEYDDMRKRHEEELKTSIEADKDGTGCMLDAFKTALKGTEYSYTGDSSDALELLGIKAEDLNNNDIMYKAFETAKRQCLGEED